MNKAWGLVHLFTVLCAVFSAQPLYAESPVKHCEELLTNEEVDPQLEMWRELSEPFTGSRPRGLEAIGQAARRDGLVVVVNGPRPKHEWRVQALEFMYGAKIVFTGDFAPGAPTVHGKGVALHPDLTPKLANVYRAEINPHMGYGRLHGSLNKWNEYVFAESVMSGAMPRTLRATELQNALPSRQEAEAMLAKLERGELERADVSRWAEVVSQFLSVAAREFPEGAFVKHVGEFATKDKNGQLMTWKADAKAIAKIGLRRIAKFRKRYEGQNLSSVEVQEAINTSAGAEARFMYALLREPQSLLVQGKLDIALTDLGKPLEFRVDFVDGEAVRALGRHSTEFYPQEAELAKRFLTQFFAKAPAQYRYLSGGADVMFLKNGEMKFIEFNFGAQSEFIDAGAGYPVIPNIYMSNLLGEPTPLIRELNRLVNWPAAKQARYLLSLDRKLGKGKWGDYSGVSFEAFHYLRNLRLVEWAKKPTREGADALIRDLGELIKFLAPRNKADQNELTEYINDIRPFIEKSLKKQ